MRILLATTELSPLTGPSALGDTAQLLGQELHRSEGIEVGVVLPAFPEITTQFGNDITDTGVSFPLAGGERRHARILECRLDRFPQVFLTDVEGDRRDQTPWTGHALIHRGLSTARAVVEMLARLDPQIDVVHCFGDAAALTSLLIKAQRLPCRTIVTPGTRGGDPEFTLAALREEAMSQGLYDLAQFLRDEPEGNVRDLCLRAADDIVPIAQDNADSHGSGRGGFRFSTDTPNDDATQLRNAGLSETAPSPVVLISSANASPALRFLDRLLDDTASAIVQARDDGSPEANATFGAFQLRYPGRFSSLRPPSSPEDASAVLDIADILLLMPADRDDDRAPRLVERWAESGRMLVLPNSPRFRHFLAASEDPDHPATQRAAFYETAHPEAVWCALKRALGHFRHPQPESHALPLAGGMPPVSQPGSFIEASHETYRGVVEAALNAPPVS